MLVFPCVSGNLTFLEKNKIINNENPLSNDWRTEVVFCYGNISDPYDFGCGYNHWIWKGFYAIDVICIINYTDRPLFRHLTNTQLCIMQMWGGIFYHPMGRITNDFICASIGFIPPRILLLLYYIQQN